MHQFFVFLWEMVRSLALPLALLLIGSGLARSWQHRNWTTQQRISDQEKINSETKMLFEEFVDLASKRHYRSRRLLWAIQSQDKMKLENELKKYDEVISAWNEAELSWKVRFVKNLNNGRYLNMEIEDYVRVPFVTIGNKIEREVRKTKLKSAATQSKITQTEVDKIESELNKISGHIFRIGREIYQRLDFLSSERLDEHQIVERQLAQGKYSELSVTQLFRATFRSSAN